MNYMKGLKDLGYRSVIDLDDDFMRLNQEILKRKLEFWSENSTIRFDNDGRCKIRINNSNLLEQELKEKINIEMSGINDYVSYYLKQSILFFTEGHETFIIENVNNADNFYSLMKDLLLSNPLINIVFEKVKNKKTKYIFNRKNEKEIVNKKIKLSKILTKMNDLMLEGEEEYSLLMKEKKDNRSQKEEIEKKLEKFKKFNPFWCQQEYLPYINTDIILSINPLDIFTCSGDESNKNEDDIILTKFHSCYATALVKDDDILTVNSRGLYSNPSWLYKLNSMLSKGILFVPNGNKLEYKDSMFFGMLNRCHFYLQDVNNVFLEQCYPSSIPFENTLNNIFKQTHFFTFEDIENLNLSKNDFYICSEFEEKVISLLKEESFYLDSIGLSFDNNRYVIMREYGISYFNNRTIGENQCCNCSNNVPIPFVENDEELEDSKVNDCYCEECIEDLTCEHCNEFNANTEDVGNRILCPDCLEEYYCRCIECGDYELISDSEKLEDDTYVCSYHKDEYCCKECGEYATSVIENEDSLCDCCKEELEKNQECC